jgi:lipoprotein-anchoring transpeptidase ErfK/SrfK
VTSQATATSRRGVYRAVAVLGVAAALAAGCSGGSSGGNAAQPGGSGGGGGGGNSAANQAPAAKVAISPAANTANVNPATPVVVKVTDGKLTTVDLADTTGKKVVGALSGDASTWTSTGPLGFGATYTVSAHAENNDGAGTDTTSKFTTLKPAKLAYDAMAPLNGAKMGVGEPIRIYFHNDANDSLLHVTNQADVIEHIKVRTSPEQPVGYLWYGSGSELHLRPQAYWKSGTQVTVSIDLQGVELAKGVFAKRSRDVSFTIGPKHYSVANTRTHRFLVYENDKLVKNFPASMGKEVKGRYTHNGTHVVIEKVKVQHMDSTTFGLALDAGGYTADVMWAVRISNNGEFAHSAPWSVAQQGVANVSHGCANLAPANAQWFFNFSQPGDVVDVTGSPVPLTQRDGDIWDWTVPWSQWHKLG